MSQWTCGSECEFWSRYLGRQGGCEKLGPEIARAVEGDRCVEYLSEWQEQYEKLGRAIATRKEKEAQA